MPVDPERGDIHDGLLRLEFPAAPLAVRGALERLIASLPANRLDPDLCSNAEIVLSEVLNNIVEHAYSGGEGRIELSIHADAAGLHCMVTDHGAAMPGGAPPGGALPDSNDADPPEGGFGWHLIRSLARDIHYRRLNGVNLLAFRLPAEQSDPMG